MFSEEHNYFRFQDDWIILGILQDNEHKKFWINQTPSSLNRFAKNLEAGHRDDKLFLDIQNHLPDFYRKLVNFGDTIEKIKKFKEDLVNFLEQIYAKWGTKLNDVWTKTAGVHVEAGSPSYHDAFNAFLRATLFKKLDIDEEYWSSTIKFVKKNSELYSTWSLVLSSPEFHEYPDLAKVYKSLKKSIEEMIQDINDLLISQKDLKGKCPFLD